MSKEKAEMIPAIKIKLNGDERPFTEKVVISDWKSATEEAAAAAEKTVDEEEFDWVLAEENIREIPEFQQVNYTPVKHIHHYRKKKGNGMQGMPVLAISVILAVIIGLALGFFILKLVVHHETAEPPVETQADVNSEAPEKIIEAPALRTATLPVLHVALIQGGFLSTKEAGEEMGRTFSAQGYPSVLIEMDSKFYLFTGITQKLSSAKVWESGIKASGADVWAKEVDFAEVDVKIASTEADRLLAETRVLYNLAEVTGNAIVSGNLNAAAVADIQNALEPDRDIQYGNEIANGLRSKLISAFKSVASFQQTNKKSDLIQAQQALLEYVLLFHEASSKPQ